MSTPPHPRITVVAIGLVALALCVAVSLTFGDDIRNYNRPASIPTPAGVTQTEIVNWPFDVNVNLRVSPQVLDEHIVVIDSPLSVTGGERWYSDPVDTSRFTSVQTSITMDRTPNGSNCHLQFQWGDGGQWFDDSLNLIWEPASRKEQVKGRKTRVSCRHGSPDDDMTIGRLEIYLRAEF